MKKLIATLLFSVGLMSTAVAGPRHYYRPYYHHDHFVAGVVTGAIIGGVLLQPRPVYPVVVQPPAYTYVRQWDNYCQCWVTVRQVVNPYYPGY